jgi:hypothetical protein
MSWRAEGRWFREGTFGLSIKLIEMFHFLYFLILSSLYESRLKEYKVLSEYGKIKSSFIVEERVKRGVNLLSMIALLILGFKLDASSSACLLPSSIQFSFKFVF